MSLLSVPQAADYLGVKETFVRRLVHEKRITYVKIGRLVRIDTAILDAFIEQGTVRPE